MKPVASGWSSGLLEQVFANCERDGSSHEGVVPLGAPWTQSGSGVPMTP